MPLLLQSITPFVTWSSALTILICQIDPRIFCLLMFIGTMWFDVICIMCIHLSHVCPFWIQCFKLQTRCDCHGHDALWLWSARCDRCRTWWISLRIMRSMHPDARSCTWIATNIDKSMTSPWWKDVEKVYESLIKSAKQPFWLQASCVPSLFSCSPLLSTTSLWR